jgi:selenocysteine lyase/cysteine desulfurase
MRQLTDRLQKEIPKLGYQPITPPQNPTPIISFLTPDYQKTQTKINQAFGGETIAFRRWEVTDAAGNETVIPGMRISPSVYNNQSDVDRLLNALA